MQYKTEILLLLDQGDPLVAHKLINCTIDRIQLILVEKGVAVTDLLLTKIYKVAILNLIALSNAEDLPEGIMNLKQVQKISSNAVKGENQIKIDRDAIIKKVELPLRLKKKSKKLVFIGSIFLVLIGFIFCFKLFDQTSKHAIGTVNESISERKLNKIFYHFFYENYFSSDKELEINESISNSQSLLDTSKEESDVAQKIDSETQINIEVKTEPEKKEISAKEPEASVSDEVIDTKFITDYLPTFLNPFITVEQNNIYPVSSKKIEPNVLEQSPKSHSDPKELKLSEENVDKEDLEAKDKNIIVTNDQPQTDQSLFLSKENKIKIGNDKQSHEPEDFKDQKVEFFAFMEVSDKEKAKEKIFSILERYGYKGYLKHESDEYILLTSTFPGKKKHDKMIRKFAGVGQLYIGNDVSEFLELYKQDFNKDERKFFRKYKPEDLPKEVTVNLYLVNKVKKKL